MWYASEVARRADSRFVSDGINGLEVGRRVHPRFSDLLGLPISYLLQLRLATQPARSPIPYIPAHSKHGLYSRPPEGV